MKISGNIVDVKNREVYSGTITVENGTISNIEKNTEHYEDYIMPGFINAHVHVESSMLTPALLPMLRLNMGQ